MKIIIRRILSLSFLFTISIAIILIYATLEWYIIDFPNIDKTYKSVVVSKLVQSHDYRKFVITFISMISIFTAYSFFKIANKCEFNIFFIYFLIFIKSLIEIILLAFIFLTMLTVISSVNYRDVIFFESETYYLIDIWGGERWGYSSPVQAYTILQCDNYVVNCRYFSTPLLVDPDRSLFDLSGKLLEIDNNLYLIVGENRIPFRQDVLLNSVRW